jgi:hypothetical protein
VPARRLAEAACVALPFGKVILSRAEAGFSSLTVVSDEFLELGVLRSKVKNWFVAIGEREFHFDR